MEPPTKKKSKQKSSIAWRLASPIRANQNYQMSVRPSVRLEGRGARSRPIGSAGFHEYCLLQVFVVHPAYNNWEGRHTGEIPEPVIYVPSAVYHRYRLTCGAVYRTSGLSMEVPPGWLTGLPWDRSGASLGIPCWHTHIILYISLRLTSVRTCYNHVQGVLFRSPGDYSCSIVFQILWYIIILILCQYFGSLKWVLDWLYCKFVTYWW